MTIRPFHRLGHKVLFGSGSLASVLLGWTGTDALWAQTPLAPEIVQKTPPIQDTSSVPRNYLNKNVIQLPIMISDSSRALIQEIHLYVKESPTAAWSLREKVGPGQKSFTFKVPSDGEYWFTMVTVDKQNRSFPADLRNEPPGLIVVIDTQRPQVELANLGQVPEGQLVQCNVRDANLDYAKVRFYYQGGDRQFRAIESVTGRPNVFCIPVQAVSTGLIRVRAEDLASNETVVEEQITRLKTATVAPAGVDLKMPPETTENKLPVLDLRPIDQVPDNKTVVQPDNKTVVQPDNKAVPPQDIKRTGYRPDGSDGPRLPDETPTITPPSLELPKRQIVNATRVFLEYQLENMQQGATTARVEVWLTRDNGKHWQLACEEIPRKNQIEVNLPGEGMYGLTLVTSNGRTTPVRPSAGQTPDCTIEVDTARPTAQITRIETTYESGQGIVNVEWNAHDKNLGDTPAELQYAATPQGPWLTVAKGLKASGQHRWSAPKSVGAQAHLRLVVSDIAGNTTVCNTLDPVQLIEQAPPRAIIRNISTGTANPGPVILPRD